ncbi:M23 family metallopeptidase [Microbacterium stercoris]|uniref:Peptidoglycan DD-metalloendopeptidase family protein n=1 Tax=Microbacterium stercoris TaxID=2820289 RepID=A0A939QHQ2_9MICO|nr:M23 family metallopeptidase [Microbacterium stercoris]MBO3663124.1 peptidoglycan DD-metalloendopeptidase family protein [Microbacterium stercoris]
MSEAPLTRRERRIRDTQNIPFPAAAVPIADLVIAEALLSTPAPVPVPAVIGDSVTTVAEAPALVESAVETPAPVEQEPAFEAEPLVEAAAAEQPAAEESDAEQPEAEQPDAEAGEPEAEPVDLFAEAARALNFTGETPVFPSEPRAESMSARLHGAAHMAPRRGPSAFRRVATVAASISAFGIVGLLAVGMTTPISALASTEQTEAKLSSAQVSAIDEVHDEIQAFVAPADAAGTAITASSGYDTTTFAEVAAATGINTANAVYQNDPTADIQWPIVLGTSKSYGFGSRWGRLHEGIDFTPGAGAPIQAIAAGTVRIGAYGAYGNNVYIDHVIDGKKITSHYAHMENGSVAVVNGQHVEVGDVLGKVGNTGRSFGAHLHFELRDAGGRSFDPMPWLQQNAGRHYDTEGGAQVASVE